ncbi:MULTISPECIES: ADP-ribosylglycohydrolase family protein [unclassified Bacillus (in: firmicutes)]|uniref:ADP-ribosylglycohydrolase family protein n=1 Tax=unclassified Bacillus (in: firmicutes) TaxID=185979 RepID=UPI0015969F77|nr:MULTISPECIES: ADP-ribosylglycohydrolase family protein [unclassified Bacillus (in: firmicutes)]
MKVKSIHFSDYLDKVHGGWIGKCVGGNIGAEVENNKYLMDLNESEIFPEEIPPNDDLDLQLLWLQVLEEKGVHLTSKDLAEAWEKHCWYPFNEYGYFLHNFERKIAPPVSGWFNNQYFSQSMGSPIRSEIWGMISIGNPSLAMQYAYKDATLDHDTESVWAEQMLAAIESQAFFESDIDTLLDFGLEQIPETSKLRKCILFIRDQYQNGMEWQQARKNMLENFGHPDASKAVQNLGITILSLLYGEKDFGKTQLIALNCGYDTDCTCATAGAILGIIGGASSLPEDWKQQAKDTFACGIDVTRPSNRISDLAMDTCRAGVAVAQSINSNVIIEGIPNDLEWEKIPSVQMAQVKISIDYKGKPALHPDQPKEIQLIIENLTETEKIGELVIVGSDDYSISPASVTIRLPEKGAIKQPVYIQAKANTSTFSSAAILNVMVKENAQIVAEDQIGLATGVPYYLIGPYWDLYDTTSENESYYHPVHKRKARPRGAENFNNYVSLDREYIAEGSFEILPEGREVYAAEHKLPLNEWIGKEGPVSVYLVQDIVSPDDREVRLMVGNNDAFKIWVNNQAVAESNKTWFWMPYNHDITVTLRKGKNRIVTKLIRTGKDFEFSLGFAKPKTHVRWINDLTFEKIKDVDS